MFCVSFRFYGFDVSNGTSLYIAKKKKKKKKKKKLNFFLKKIFFILTKKVLKNIVKVIQVILSDFK